MLDVETINTHIGTANDEFFGNKALMKDALRENNIKRQKSQQENAAEEEFQYTAKPIYDVCKRLFDIVLCTFSLVILLPFLLIIMLIIEIDDPKGAPIFSQVRCGKDGKEFKIYKLRTMCSDAENKIKEYEKLNEMDGPVFKIKNDPRITRIGKFLRSSGIDELPQLVNIIKGDMSIVGPRPALPSEVEQYGETSKVRLRVLPGLTCYWQIVPNRNDVTFEKWMELDRKYVAERSFLLDVKLIFKTFLTVIHMQGC